jgi:hypothetical protein
MAILVLLPFFHELCTANGVVGVAAGHRTWGRAKGEEMTDMWGGGERTEHLRMGEL